MQLYRTHLKLRLASWLSEPSSLDGISHGETLSSHLPIKKKQRREMHGASVSKQILYFQNSNINEKRCAQQCAKNEPELC